MEISYKIFKISDFKISRDSKISGSLYEISSELWTPRMEPCNKDSVTMWGELKIE